MIIHIKKQHSTNQAPIHSVPYPPVICSQTQALENAPHRERVKLSGAQNRKRKREREKDVVGMKKSFSKWLKDSRLVSLYALFTYVTFVYQNETVGLLPCYLHLEGTGFEGGACSTKLNWKKDVAESAVCSLVERLRSRSSARYIQAEVEDEHEEVSQPRQLIPLGAPAGVLTVNLKTCRDFSKSALLKKGSRAAVRITIGRTVKYTVQQPYSDPMRFDEWKHFSLQIQKEDICGVQQSSLVVVELIMVDPDLTTPVLIGRDTIMLQDILKKSSLSHQFNLRLMQKKVCKLDADLAFSYGSMGYGYSHQIKHAGRTIESLVEKSLFPRCPPNEDRDPLCNVITPSARTRLDFIPSVML
ncbi:hypothetical protein SRHO_G00002600 [Serrasalmus rhombeus]